MSRLRGVWVDFMAKPDNADARRLWADIRARQPRFVEAVVADARMAAANRGERSAYRSRWDTLAQIVRLAVVTDAFLGQIFYRAKVATHAKRIPLVPRLLHRLAVSQGQIVVGDPVVIHPGVFIPHGQVVIDGITEIESRVMIGPWTTIGLVAGEFLGPTIRTGVKVGTGARILGPLEIGAHTVVGANAVVVRDLPADAVAVGVPAKIISSRTSR